MRYPAASSGVSPRGIILFAASGGEFNPERLKNNIKGVCFMKAKLGIMHEKN